MENLVHAACPHDCPDACAMVVTVRDGVAVSVRGDREHPFTRGTLCAKVNDYQVRAYHPDRVLHPLRRTGPKGAGRFEPVTWDEAVAEICDRLRTVCAEHGPESVLPYVYAGNLSLLNGMTVADPFMHRLGATVLERTSCISCRSSAYVATVGPAVIDPESIVHARCIVIWGCNVLTSNQHLWPFIREARRRGATVTVIDPYRTKTAEQADWHIPIRPGTDGALALGLAQVIIAEGLLDQDYVERHTSGFDELRARAAAFPPARVEEITGIPAADVRRLARELATVQPSLIRVGVAVERSEQGGAAFRAIFSLPALTGSWRHQGGGVLEMPLWAFPVRWDVLSRTDWLHPGRRTVNMLQLGQALTGELQLDPPIHALVVANANPAVNAPEQAKVLAGLARDDLFTVVAEHFVTDTARFADFVLPATTVLEHLDLTISWGHLYLNANLPAVEAQGEAVPNTELFRRLAAGMGFTDEWFKLTDEQMAAEVLDWSAPALEGITLDRLWQEGWARLATLPPDGPPPYAEGGFPTPSGKVEIRSSLLEQLGGPFVLGVFREGYEGDVTPTIVDPVPDWRPPADDGRFGLTMLSPKSHAFLNSQYANQARQRTIEGPQPVLLNPADARRRGIADGAAVRVWNDVGEFLATAALRDDVVSGAVVCPHGRWHSHAGGAGTSLANNATTPATFSDLGRGPRLSDVRVEVTPAT